MRYKVTLFPSRNAKYTPTLIHTYQCAAYYLPTPRGYLRSTATAKAVVLKKQI